MDKELHNAIKEDNEIKIQDLLKNGASINNLLGMKGTPLCTAIYAKRPEVIDLLLSLGCDVNAKDFDGEPPLCLALRLELFHLAEKLIKNKKCNVNKIDPISQKRPIHIAADLNHLETVKNLVDSGCDINSRDSKGNTALHICILMHLKQQAVTKFLIDSGCDIYTYNSKGHLPIHSCVVSNNVEAMHYLIRTSQAKQNDVESIINIGTQGFNETPLLLAVQLGNLEILQELLKYECDLNLANSQNETPLFMACKLNVTQIAIALVDARACPNIVGTAFKYKHNHTQLQQKAPIHEAIFLGNFKVVKKIIEGGGDINIQDSLGNTPLHFALLKNKPEIANYLIDVGITNSLDVTKFTKTQESLLFAVSSCIEPAKLTTRLINELHCDVNHVAKFQREVKMALDVAVEMNCIPVVDVLLEHGADPESVYKYSKFTCLHTCASEDLVGVASALIQWGADLNVQADIDGEEDGSPFYMALSSGNMDMAALLLACGCTVKSSLLDSDFLGPFAEEEFDVSPHILSLAKYRATCPLPLTFLCRLEIILFFKTNRLDLNLCSKLPLPKDLIHFIRFKTLDKYKYAPIPLNMIEDLSLN